jgi:hypothetical protein
MVFKGKKECHIELHDFIHNRSKVDEKKVYGIHCLYDKYKKG